MPISEKNAFRRKLVSLILPMTLQNFMFSLVPLSDTIMLVSDQNAMSAVSLASQVAFVFSMFSMAISSGANNLGSQGMAELERYGITTGYTHRAVTEDMDCPMNEESLVWYRIQPTKEVDGEIVPVPHNFKVVRRAESLNHLIYYLKEVDVS